MPCLQGVITHTKCWNYLPVLSSKANLGLFTGSNSWVPTCVRGGTDLPLVYPWSIGESNPWHESQIHGHCTVPSQPSSQSHNTCLCSDVPLSGWLQRLMFGCDVNSQSPTHTQTHTDNLLVGRLHLSLERGGLKLWGFPETCLKGLL